MRKAFICTIALLVLAGCGGHVNQIRPPKISTDPFLDIKIVDRPILVAMLPGIAGAFQSECVVTESGTELSCSDGIDNDCDGDTDTADSDCGVSYMLRETWNEETEDNEWTIVTAGTWNDDLESPTPPEGAQWLSTDICVRYASFTGTDDEIYIAWYWQMDSGESSTAHTLGVRDSSGNNLFRLTMTWDTDHYYPRLYYNSNGSQATAPGTSIAAGTTVLFKIRYDNGSSAGIELYYSTLPFSSWTSLIAPTDHTDYAQAARVYIGDVAETELQYWDDIRVNTTAGGGDSY